MFFYNVIYTCKFICTLLYLDFIPFSPADQKKYLCSVDPDEIAFNEPSHQDLLFAILFLILD